MNKSTDSGYSLTAEDIERFIASGDNPPRRELVAPNYEIAKQWAKQYPSCTILVSPKMLPTKPKGAGDDIQDTGV